MADPITIAGVTAGANFLGNLVTGKQNRAQRKWQEKMWNKTNEYNSPVMQMQRFKEAGLNPHLIYGQGNNGNTSMPSAPQQFQQDFSGYADAAMNYVATKKQNIEIDNMKKAAEVMEADIISKQASAVNSLSNSAKTDQERQQSAETFGTLKEQLDANLANTRTTGKKLEAEISNILESTKLTTQQRAESLQRIQESTARIESMRIDNNLKGVEIEIKKIELGLKKAGINPNDPAWARILGRVLEESGITDEIINTSKEELPLLKKIIALPFSDLPKRFIQWNWGTRKNPW